MKPIATAVAGAALSFAASAAFALPPEWNTFVNCTLEFKPRRPPGKFETIVYVSDVVTKCYSEAPPGGLPAAQDQSGPRGPSEFDRQTADAIPCARIPALRKSLRDRLPDARDELRDVSTAIDNGEAALRIATEVSVTLEREARAARASCTRAENRYQAELIALYALMADECRPRRPISDTDCLDEKRWLAEKQLEGGNSQVLATGLCQVARGRNDFYTRQDQVRINLSRELSRSIDRQTDLRREVRQIESALRTLDEREKTGGDCKK